MMSFQTAVIQSTAVPEAGLPLAVSEDVPIPNISSPHQVLIRVLAVALNPTDFKMANRFHMEHNVVGCDFCGVVERAGTSAMASFPEKTRVCGAVFPYRPNNRDNGAFSQLLVADSRHLLRVPRDWTDTQAAALGGVGWSTVCLSMSDPEALGLEGRPRKPVEKPVPVIVHGGATATGLMAIQLLKISGYAPIAVCSSSSAPLAIRFGAVGTASYTSSRCTDEIKAHAQGVPIRYALDCITEEESTSTCFAALGRTGGRYACLEELQDSWRTRRAVKVKVVMGYEIQGEDIEFEHDVYTRKARPELHAIGMEWAKDMQGLLDAGVLLKPPVREVEGGFNGVLTGLHELKAGKVRGGKLTVRLSSLDGTQLV